MKREPMRRLWLIPMVLCLAGCGHAWPARADALDALQARVIDVSKRTSPAVVHVEAAVRMNNRGRIVTGSGFVTDASGIVLTNWHVVDKARRVHVIVPGRAGRYPAEVVGTDKQTDLAVLRIEPRPGDAPLPVAKLGDSDSLTVGEWVIAIGNPYGLDGTVSLGIVSGKGRDLPAEQILNDFIQTDAMIDHGSSGGPLLNLKGEVVGVNSRGQGRGIGFTIPINTAKRVSKQLIGGGRIARAWLGVSVQPLDRDLAGYWGMPDVQGVVVGSVLDGSPAKAAGLQVGDILTELDGEPLAAEKDEDLGDFQRRIALLDVGHKARMRVRRGSESLELSARLASQPKVVPDEEETPFGFTVQELTEDLLRQYRLRTRQGVLVSYVELGSEAAQAELQPGDVIVRVDALPVSTLAEFRSALDALPPGRTFLITALRGDDTRFVLIQPGTPPVPPAALQDQGTH
jgi:S1-C subfamily serine protease